MALVGKFVGVQKNLAPIRGSLKSYLSKIEPFDSVIIRGPFGIDPEERGLGRRPLKFDSALVNPPISHLDIVDTRVTMFIGSPYLATDWRDIPRVINAMSLFCNSLCFEGLIEWNASWGLAYNCCRMAGIEFIAEGIPRAGEPVPASIPLLLQSNRLMRWVSGRTDSDEIPYEKVDNKILVIVDDDALQARYFISKMFGKVDSLDQLQQKLESKGFTVYRRP